MGDRARTIAIMKDPAVGPIGVIAIVLVLLLKFSALASLSMPAWPALLLAPLLARAALVALFLTTPYVRLGGLGDDLQRAPRKACLIVLVAAMACCVIARWRGAWMLLAAGVVFACWRQACMRRLGGCTGDTAGALVEMIEAAVLVISAVA
jgi:adenosylcobinamide-GDP ribazoletransferase